jgi:hypothetical protein
MKFNLQTRNVQSVGAITSKEVSISANAKAYKLLFGQIYPDIIRAIVRELFTNAWDSQKVAGTLDQPISIHLPTTWEPYFAIRDYGTGMTEQVIDDVYMNVFESTKDKSDDEAGQFGMGSKTPLGYTDSFAVTSYVDGIFWFYDIYFNESGKVKIDLKATGETDEPNGVEVSLAVKETDFDAFKENTEHFILRANTPVEINREKFIQKISYLKEGNGWQLVDPTSNSGMTLNTQIRMGCVLYKVQWNYIYNSLAQISTNLTYNQISKFVGQSFVLDFKIGDFEVTGSREDIVYNNDSVQKLVSKIEEVIGIFIADADKDIRAAASHEEAFHLLKTYRDLGYAPSSPKYGALSIVDRLYFKTNSQVITGIDRHNKPYIPVFIKRNPFKKPRGRINPDHSSSLEINRMYDRADRTKFSYFILRQVDEEVTKIGSRLENFMETLAAKGRNHCNSDYYNGYDIYMVDYEKIEDLKRLHVYAPKKSLFVHLNDIDPVPPQKRERRTKGDFSGFTTKAVDENGTYLVWLLKLKKVITTLLANTAISMVII